MSKPNFIVSTDSSSDFLISELKAIGVCCITMKYIIDGKEIDGLYDSYDDFHAFYDTIKKGALPTTTQTNEYEFTEYFEKILKENPQGDIIHLTISSGLSGTYFSGVAAVEKLNAKLKDRKIYLIDSLTVTVGLQMLVREAVRLRDLEVSTAEALKGLESMIDHQHLWLLVDDLSHLKRGGRISGFKATVGALLKVKPIIAVNSSGKLAKENSIKGSKNAVHYILDRMKTYGEAVKSDFSRQTVYIIYAPPMDLCDYAIECIRERWPQMDLREVVLGPIVGSHVGPGAVAVCFEGAERIKS